MKRILFFLLLLQPLSFSLVYSQDCHIDGIYYNIITQEDGSKAASVTNAIGGKDINFDSTTKYVGDIVIPDSISFDGERLPVVRIEQRTFLYCGVKSVVLPRGVKQIEAATFYCCVALTTVALPSELESIGPSAFSQCLNLSKVNLPPSVSYIGNQAFCECISLESFKVGTSVKYFGDEAFVSSNISEISFSKDASIGKDVLLHCNNLSSIEVEEGHPVYDSRENCNALIESASNKIVRGSAKTMIPASVQEIGDYAFDCCEGIQSVQIPDSCTRIGEKAFFKCSSLQSVTLPEGLTSIDNRAFCLCDTLSEIHLPASLTSLGDGVFMQCRNLREMTIPESITVIPNNAFFCCWKLSDVQLPSTLRNIGENAFPGCHFTSIDLPSSVRYIGPGAFQGCDELTTITLPDSLTSISERTFVGCPVLQDVTLPEGLQSVGKDAFSHSYALKNIIAKMKDPFPFGQMALYSVPKGQMTLYIPEGTRDAYTQAGWLNFIDNVIEMTETGIQDITSPSDKSVNSESENSTFVNSNFLDLSGRHLPTLPTRKGIYIKDGRKVLIK